LFGISEPSTVMTDYDPLSLNLKIDDKSEMESVFTSGKKSNVSYIFISQKVP